MIKLLVSSGRCNIEFRVDGKVAVAGAIGACEEENVVIRNKDSFPNSEHNLQSMYYMSVVRAKCATRRKVCANYSLKPEICKFLNLVLLNVII